MAKKVGRVAFFYNPSSPEAHVVGHVVPLEVVGEGAGRFGRLRQLPAHPVDHAATAHAVTHAPNSDTHLGPAHLAAPAAHRAEGGLALEFLGLLLLLNVLLVFPAAAPVVFVGIEAAAR